MLEPTFSVVIPTCDRPRYLPDAVNSVLDQTCQAHEIFIIDNGRQPVSKQSIPHRADLELVRALPRFGVAQARNLGAVLASGDFIAFLDDDDRWSASYLAEMCRTIQETNADLILGRLRDGNTAVAISGKQAAFQNREDLVRQILLRNPGVVGSNFVVARALFCSSSGYDPWLTTGEDKALGLDLLLAGAKPARAASAWVEFRLDTQGPRQTDLRNEIQGRSRFLHKYWPEFNGRERLVNLVQLMRLHSRRLIRSH